MKFSELKVVELAAVLAGPSVGMFFAEMGAQVVKIENPKTKGDMTRHWKLPTENPAQSTSAYYSSINYGKSVQFIDYSTTAGYNELVALIRDCDILLTNFKPGSAQKLRLDFETVQSIQPEVIYAEITGFGATDKRSAFDVVLQAESGFMGMMGHPNQAPVKMPVALIDVLAAHHLKEGILTALLQKEPNTAQKVDVSLYDAAVSSLVNQASNYLMAQHIPQPMGAQHPNIAPYGDTYLTQDKKWLVLAVGTDRQFQQLIQLLQVEHLLGSEEFAKNPTRVTHRERLNAILQKAIENYPREELIDLLLSKNVPCGAVKTLHEVFEDEKAQQLILREKFENTDTQRVKSKVFTLTSSPA